MRSGRTGGWAASGGRERSPNETRSPSGAGTASSTASARLFRTRTARCSRWTSAPVSVLRTHALSGYSLALAQYTGGRVTLADGTAALLEAIVSAAPVEMRLATPVAALRAHGGRVEVETRAGAVHAAAAAVVAVPLNVLGAIEFEPALSEGKQEAITLGQGSRGAKIF